MFDLLTHLSSLERELHQATTRASASRLIALLHHDFIEVGYSGRRYDRSLIIQRLTVDELIAGAPTIESMNFHLTLLAADTALLTYESAHRADSGLLERHARRCSIWRLNNSSWQMIYHQGTPYEPT